MFGRYIYHHLAQRSILAEDELATDVPVMYVTASTTATGPIAGYTTSESSTQSTSLSTLTSSLTKTWTTSKESSTTTPLPTSATSSSKKAPSPTPPSPPSPPPSPPPPPPSPPSPYPIAPAPAPTQTPPSNPSPPSPPPPPPAQYPTSAAVDAPQNTQPPAPPAETIVNTITPIVEAPTTSSTILPANLVATDLKDLPQSIPSPAATVPISMPLLVATSSTPAVIYSTSMGSYPAQITPSSAPTSSQSAIPGSPGMTATGKVSLIFGVVLLLGAASIMFQIYVKRNRQSQKERQIDNEKQAFGGQGMTSKSNQKITSLQTSLNNSTSGPPSAQSIANSTSKENSRANPFGNHAEILVDAVNASGPKVIDKMGPGTPHLTRVASKRGQMSPNSAPMNNAVKYTPGQKNADENENARKYSAPNTPNVGPANGNTPGSGRASGVYRVQLDFTPSMDDELELRSGQLIRVLHEFDDGWAMCVRLDCSEQGVCPRTCLSTRPLKPRSPSQGSQSHNSNINPKEFGPLPMLPNGQPGQSPRNSGNSQYNVHMKPPVPSKNNMIPRPQQLDSDQKNEHLPSNLPLKNAARYVSLTLQGSDHSTPQAISELSASPGPVDDYFSFVKPTAEAAPVENLNATRLPSPSFSQIGTEMEIPAEYLSEKQPCQKPVPGQAL